jgi:peptide deformylase
MAKLDILRYPDKRLRQVAKPVTDFNDSVRTLSENMAETMYGAPGIGLAAVQVTVALRVVVMDLSEEKNDLKVLINPEIVKQEGSVCTEEGCLSVPEIYAEVERAEKVTVRAQDVDGNTFEIEADELLAVCIQHEIDHLNGKVFVDYLSRMKQDRIRKKLLKEARLDAA